ncbi:hypothetical protein HDV63DRAFT_369178 [Trichoderma sp. SZMC 28014]
MLPINQLGITTSQRMQPQTREAFIKVRPTWSNKPVKPRLHKGWTVSAITLGKPKSLLKPVN